MEIFKFGGVRIVAESNCDAVMLTEIGIELEKSYPEGTIVFLNNEECKIVQTNGVVEIYKNDLSGLFNKLKIDKREEK